MHGYENDALRTRLHRIEGQVRGIERMVDDDRRCIDVLTQVGAVRTALESLALELLSHHVARCFADALASRDEQTVAAKRGELLAAVERYARTA